MKAEGSRKQLYSDRKTVAVPPDMPGAPPGERLAWHRAIPTDVDPWPRPFSYWDRPWKQVCADSLSGGVYSCGSQAWEIRQQEKLKESMRLRLRDPSSNDQEGEEGEESDSTHDTQVSIAQHSEVVVSGRKVCERAHNLQAQG